MFVFYASEINFFCRIELTGRPELGANVTTRILEKAFRVDDDQSS